MIQIKDNYKFGADPTMEDQIRRINNWIYKTKTSNLDRPSGPVAQRIEALSLYGSRFQFLPKPARGLLDQKRGAIDNNYGYGYKTQHSYPRSWLITWRRPEVKFGRNVVKKKQHKNYQDEDKKSAINKKL